MDRNTEQQVQYLVDRQELWDLITRYSMAVDDRDLDTLISCFTHDASMGHADGATTGHGPEGIRSYYESKMVEYGHCYHYAHSQLVEFDGPDAAHGKVNAHAELVVNGVFILNAIRYDDVYAREGGAWRFQQRRTKFFYSMPFDELPTKLSQPDRKRFPGPPSAAELPESLPSYQAFLARTRG